MARIEILILSQRWGYIDGKKNGTECSIFCPGLSSRDLSPVEMVREYIQDFQGEMVRFAKNGFGFLEIEFWIYCILLTPGLG